MGARYDHDRGEWGHQAREEPVISKEDKATILANAILEKKGEEIVLLEVTKLLDFADTFILATGSSPPHLDAMSDAVLAAGKAAGFKSMGVEGSQRSSWILIDFGDVVVHLFSKEGRGVFDLDGLWCDAPRTELNDEDLPNPASAGA